MDQALNFITGKMWLEGKRRLTAKRKSSTQAENKGHSCYSLEEYFIFGIKKKKKSLPQKCDLAREKCTETKYIISWRFSFLVSQGY